MFLYSFVAQIHGIVNGIHMKFFWHRASQKRRHESGQIVIMVLLILAVMITVVVSYAVRTTQELSLSTQQAESTRVFSAAEAAAEKVLSGQLTTGPQSIQIGDIEVQALVSAEDFEYDVQVGESIEIDTSTLATGNQVRLSWQVSDASCAFLLVSEFYEQSGSMMVRHASVRPDYSCGSANASTATAVASTTGTSPQYNYAVDAQSVSLRVKPLYAGTRITATGPGTLGTQSVRVVSSAQNPNGPEQRTVEVKRTLPFAPGFMDFTVFSGGDLDK